MGEVPEGDGLLAAGGDRAKQNEVVEALGRCWRHDSTVESPLQAAGRSVRT